LSARERLLGAEHPETLHTMESLALILLELGDYMECKVLQEKALAGRLFGAEHPETLRIKGDLAVSLMLLGDDVPPELSST
jgi:hypothetical protein